jgi:hypothetical protein
MPHFTRIFFKFFHFFYIEKIFSRAFPMQANSTNQKASFREIVISPVPGALASAL